MFEVDYKYGLLYKQPWLPSPVRIYKRVRTYRAALEAVQKVLTSEYAPETVAIVQLETSKVVTTFTKEETSG
jgi:hypothetical protein